MILTSKIRLAPKQALTMLQKAIVFRDGTVVLVDLDPYQGKTRLRYFESNEQVHNTLLQGTIESIQTLENKQLLLVNPSNHQLLTVSYLEENPVILRSQVQWPETNPRRIKLLTFNQSKTFALLAESLDNDQVTISCYKYPFEFVSKQVLPDNNRTFVKMNQKGQIGIYSHDYQADFQVQLLDLFGQEPSTLHTIQLPRNSVQKVIKYKEQRLLILLSNNQGVVSYDLTYKTIEPLIDIQSPCFKYSDQVDPAKNMIFSWIPLQQTLVLLVNNSTHNIQRIFVCSYNGSVIDSHESKIDNCHRYFTRPGRREHIEMQAPYRQPFHIEIDIWTCAPPKQLYTLLLEQLGLTQQMVAYSVNSFNYDK